MSEPIEHKDYLRLMREDVRSQRHHDILRDVLKELVKDSLRTHTKRGVDHPEEIDLNVRTSRAYADLTYPPPKGEP